MGYLSLASELTNIRVPVVTAVWAIWNTDIDIIRKSIDIINDVWEIDQKMLAIIVWIRCLSETYPVVSKCHKLTYGPFTLSQTVMSDTKGHQIGLSRTLCCDTPSLEQVSVNGVTRCHRPIRETTCHHTHTLVSNRDHVMSPPAKNIRSRDAR